MCWRCVWSVPELVPVCVRVCVCAFAFLLRSNLKLCSCFPDISQDPVSAEEQARFEENKQELDRFLGPYPYER